MSSIYLFSYQNMKEVLYNACHILDMNPIYLLLMFRQSLDKLLLRTTFGQRSARFSDIGGTRTGLFLKLAPLVSDRRYAVDQYRGLSTAYINICSEAGQTLENTWAATLTGYWVFGYRVFTENIYKAPSFFCEPYHSVQLDAVPIRYNLNSE